MDLERISWRRGRYDAAESGNLYTADHARATKIIQAVRDKVSDTRQMRALGFCVGVAHAKFMSERFNLSGIPSVAVSAGAPRQERQQALRDLRNGTINAVFAVDLFNEGVNIRRSTLSCSCAQRKVPPCSCSSWGADFALQMTSHALLSWTS